MVDDDEIIKAANKFFSGVGSALKKGAQSAAKAGKAVSYASPGAGSPMHIVGEWLNKAAGVKFSHVPYRGVGPSVTDVVAGHVPMMAADSSAVLPFIKSGQVKPLGIASVQRSPLVPDIPTLDEQGLHGFETGGWFGVFAPKGTPPEIVKLLSEKLQAAMVTPQTKEAVGKTGLTPAAVDANAAGFFEPNDRGAYTINDITGVRNDDGTLTVRFGEHPAGAANVIPITEGWNYLVRLYRPRAEVLDGSWTFPTLDAPGSD